MDISSCLKSDETKKYTLVNHENGSLLVNTIELFILWKLKELISATGTSLLPRHDYYKQDKPLNVYKRVFIRVYIKNKTGFRRALFLIT